MELIRIETDSTQRELTRHGEVDFPLVVNHDRLFEFYERRISCHWHEELEIPLVVRGRVRYTLREQTFVLGEGEGLLINSRVPHSALPLDGTQPELLTAVFSPELLYGSTSGAVYKRLLGPYMNSRLAGLRLDSEGAAFMLRAGELSSARPFGWELEVTGGLCIMLSRLLSGHQDELRHSAPASGEALERLRVLTEAIQSGFAERLPLDELAAKVSLSRESCCRFFKSMTGQTISQYLEDCRVSRGAQLLRESSDSVTQVAYQVGFGNPGRFSRAFAQRMGCTPSEYRRSLNGRGERG